MARTQGTASQAHGFEDALRRLLQKKAKHFSPLFTVVAKAAKLSQYQLEEISEEIDNFCPEGYRLRRSDIVIKGTRAYNRRLALEKIDDIHCNREFVMEIADRCHNKATGTQLLKEMKMVAPVKETCEIHKDLKIRRTEPDQIVERILQLRNYIKKTTIIGWCHCYTIYATGIEGGGIKVQAKLSIKAWLEGVYILKRTL